MREVADDGVGFGGVDLIAHVEVIASHVNGDKVRLPPVGRLLPSNAAVAGQISHGWLRSILQLTVNTSIQLEGFET